MAYLKILQICMTYEAQSTEIAFKMSRSACVCVCHTLSTFLFRCAVINFVKRQEKQLMQSQVNRLNDFLL